MGETKKARSLAVILSLILPGLGHFYLGRWLRGAAFLVVTLGLLQLVGSDLTLDAIASGTALPALEHALVVLFALIVVLLLCIWDTLRIARRQEPAPAE